MCKFGDMSFILMPVGFAFHISSPARAQMFVPLKFQPVILQDQRGSLHGSFLDVKFMANVTRST